MYPDDRTIRDKSIENISERGRNRKEVESESLASSFESTTPEDLQYIQAVKGHE